MSSVPPSRSCLRDTATRSDGSGISQISPRCWTRGSRPAGSLAWTARRRSTGGGLVSTATDVLRFCTAMADGGAPVLTAGSRDLLTADALTDPQLR